MSDETAWPFAGRAEELTRFRRLLASPRARGLVLAGPAGVGKTRTALECLRIVDRIVEASGHGPGPAAGGRWFVARAAGHQASAELPFGALAHLLPLLDAGTDVPAQDRSGLLHRFAAALTTMAGDRRLLLLVDDAHLLDNSSATLLYQLAVTDAAFVLATVRAGESAPDPVVALWKDGVLERVELAGLPPGLTGELVGAALGGPVDPETLLTLVDRCDGNALFLRELVLGALDDGTLRREDGMWRLVGPPHPSSRLVELVESRLCGLAPEERALLELVSYGEPLGRAELDTLGDPELAERLERKGLLSVRLNHRRLEVRLGHPVYGDVIRAGLPVLRVQSMARALAESVEAYGARRREDILRVGGWRLVGGGGSPQLMLAAATSARWRYDFELAQRLVLAAQELGAGFDADLLAARLAGIQGRSDLAENLLAGLAKLADEADDDERRSEVAIARMDNFLYSSGSEESLRVATEAESRITDRLWRDEITARRSTILVTTAGPRETLRAVTPLLAGTTDTALVWACLTGARSLARLGRAQEAHDLTARGLDAHRALGRPIEWYPWFHLFNRCEALLGVGRLREAEELARVEHHAGLADRSPEAQACFALQLAKIHMARGRIRTAADRAREAVGIFRRIGRPMFLHEALHTLGCAFAIAGDAAGARRELGAVAGLSLPNMMYDAADLLQSRAWSAVADGHLPKARALCEEAAGLGLRTGDLVAASAALHNLARFGRAREVGTRLDRLAEQIDPGLVGPRAAHVRCLAAGDARGLEEVAEAFSDLGAGLLAADATADAAVAWTRLGHPRAAAAATRNAIRLADACEGAGTPALRSIAARARLTPAEREAAALAAAGHSNKQIADELTLSVRSIENRLQHVYDKLGISGRDELAGALDLTGPGRPS
ncbi:MAG TPA: AAA family ATPase [Pseudonocardia sp.]|nr:AAA family ATPase [Pseudonocardia sp.]